MNIENVKTVALFCLVAISLFLSFHLWGSRPVTDTTQQKYLQNNMTVQKKEVLDVLMPSQMIVHKGEKDFGAPQSVYLDDMYRWLQQGEFVDFRDITTKIQKNDFSALVHGDMKTELIFPTSIPFETIKSFFYIKEKGLTNYSFDRIVINLDPAVSHDKAIKVYFVSYGERKVYETTFKYDIKQLESTRNQFVERDAKHYFAYRPNETYTIFLPEDETALPTIPYVTGEVKFESYRDALFTDPRYLTVETTPSEERYTDGTKILKINRDTRMLSYENLVAMNNGYTKNAFLIQRSIDSINSHGGWTDPYRFYYSNVKKGQTEFRLFVNGGYPVFNTQGMATLKQVWGIEELTSYKRPLFNMKVKLPNEDGAKLPSGYVVAQSLDKADLRNIRSIDYGYEMVLENIINGRGVKLKPIWIVAYETLKDGVTYKKFTVKQGQGGELSGLE